MKRLTDAQIESYRQEMITNWKRHNLHDTPARFEAPLGELVGNLAGFAWAWKMKGEMPKIVDISKSDRFNAQGLEGKFARQCTLGDAIVYASQCDPGRFAIYV